MKSILCCALLCAFTLGCSDGAPERVAIRGSVNVDGAPLPKGSIVFVPTSGTEGPRAAGTIENGSYTIPKDQGPVVGKMRVEIFAEQNLGFALDDAEDVVRNAVPNEVIPPNPIPPEYNQESTLVRETLPGDNTLDFEIATNTETEN